MRGELILSVRERGGVLSLLLPMLLSMLLLIASGMVAQAAPAGKCAVASRVQAAAADFMRAGRSGSPAAIRRVLNRHVDMRRVMTFALGRDIRRMSRAERRRYYRQGTDYAARKLATLARSLRGSGIEIVRCRGNRVESRLLPSGNRVVWKLRGRRIVDVNFRGVWMAFILRDHFRRMWRQSGQDARAFLARLEN